MRRFASLRRRSDFTRLRHRGQVTRTRDLTIYRSAGADPKPLVGISIGKLVGGAVSRNRLRRRLQSVLQTTLREFPQRVLIVPGPSADSLSFLQLADQLQRALH